MKQSIDYLRTLQPEMRIANLVTLYRPDADRNPLWVCAVNIGQSDFVGRQRTGKDYTLDLVGAADVRRSGVYARAAGEAVERWALKPTKVHKPIIAQINAPRGALWAAKKKQKNLQHMKVSCIAPMVTIILFRCQLG